jgi:flavin-binding protein dodecin
MNEAVESARETFRKLAVFEIDPKQSTATHTDWANASALLESADTVDKIYWRQRLSNDNYQSLMQQIGKDDELREMFGFYHGPYDQRV